MLLTAIFGLGVLATARGVELDSCAVASIAQRKFDDAKAKWDSSSADSPDFPRLGEVAFNSEIALGFIDIGCGKIQQAMQIAQDIDSQDPGDAVAALMEVIVYIHNKDQFHLSDFYANGLKQVARGPTVEMAGYYDLTTLLLKKAVCQASNGASQEICKSEPDLVFSKDMPSSLQVLIHMTHDGTLTCEDLVNMPDDYRRYANLFLYLQRQEASDKTDVLAKYALDEYEWRSQH